MISYSLISTNKSPESLTINKTELEMYADVVECLHFEDKFSRSVFIQKFRSFSLHGFNGFPAGSFNIPSIAIREALSEIYLSNVMATPFCCAYQRHFDYMYCSKIGIIPVVQTKIVALTSSTFTNIF